MAENSKIQWTDATFNAWRGCTKVSAGCAHCYAETLSGRNPGTLGVWGPNGTRVVAAEAQWKLPARWNALAAAGKLPDGTPNADGHRPRVFCASLADVFEDWRRPMLNHERCHVWTDGKAWKVDQYHSAVMFTESNPGFRPLAMDDVRARLFTLIAATPYLDWLLLTKRPENINPTLARLRAAGLVASDHLPWDNVWLGTSVENQAAADARIPHLLATPAAVRFLSCEPLLGQVDLLRVGAAGFGGPASHKVDCIRKGYWSQQYGFVNHSDMHDKFGPLHWVIAGGESGPGARPMNIEWVRSLVRQCREAASVPVFVKQLGSQPYYQTPDMHGPQDLYLRDKKGGDPDEWPEDLRVREFPRPAA